jgi:hypothetical protein
MFPNIKNKFRGKWLEDEDWVEPRHHSHKRRQLYKDRLLDFTCRKSPCAPPYPYFTFPQLQKGWQRRSTLYQGHATVRFIRRRLDQQRWPLKMHTKDL